MTVHSAAFDEKLNRFVVGGDDSGEPANFRGHVGHGGALIHAEVFYGLASVFNDFGKCLAAAHVLRLRIFKMMSFAVTFACFLPRTIIFTDSGTRTRTSFVIHELNTSVVPIPKATQPIAPECGVWESEPTINWPGNA